MKPQIPNCHPCYHKHISGNVTPSLGALVKNELTLMLVAKIFQYKIMQKTLEMTETLAYGYSSESTQQEIYNEYRHDRVNEMVFKNRCILVDWTKVAPALKGLRKIDSVE